MSITKKHPPHCLQDNKTKRQKRRRIYQINRSTPNQNSVLKHPLLHIHHKNQPNTYLLHPTTRTIQQTPWPPPRLVDSAQRRSQAHQRPALLVPLSHKPHSHHLPIKGKINREKLKKKKRTILKRTPATKGIGYLQRFSQTDQPSQLLLYRQSTPKPHKPVSQQASETSNTVPPQPRVTAQDPRPTTRPRASQPIQRRHSTTRHPPGTPYLLSPVKPLIFKPSDCSNSPPSTWLSSATEPTHRRLKQPWSFGYEGEAKENGSQWSKEKHKRIQKTSSKRKVMKRGRVLMGLPAHQFRVQEG